MHVKPLIRNIAVLVVLAFGFIISCKKDNNPTSPPSNLHLNKGLLLYLPFDGNMADSSGNGNTTVPVGGVALTYDEHGAANSALGGTGNGERLEVINNGSIKFDTAFAISYNFLERPTAIRQAFMSMVDPATGKGPTFTSGTDIPNLPNFDFGANDISTGCGNYGGDNPNLVNDTANFIPKSEAWYNFIGIYHKGSIQLYINGKLVSSKSGSGTAALLCPASKIIVGGWWDQDPISFNGKIDEVRMYNRVLNADEIADLSKNFQED